MCDASREHRNPPAFVKIRNCPCINHALTVGSTCPSRVTYCKWVPVHARAAIEHNNGAKRQKQCASMASRRPPPTPAEHSARHAPRHYPALSTRDNLTIKFTFYICHLSRPEAATRHWRILHWLRTGRARHLSRQPKVSSFEAEMAMASVRTRRNYARFSRH